MKHLLTASLVCLFATGNLYAEHFGTDNKALLKEHVLEQCTLSTPKECDCLANKLIDQFNGTDWKIFEASGMEDESIKNRVSKKEIDSYLAKLDNAVNSCAVEVISSLFIETP